MDREDRRRYFIVGSVILEIVTPLFRQRLENEYRNLGLGSLQAFLNRQPIIHILFHLRHRNVWCCTDRPKCLNAKTLPMTHHQWDLLYSENPGQLGHNCHCKFSSKAVQLDDLDITLSGLILINCCNLGPDEQHVCILRQFKNDYLSHNSKGGITQAEYNTLWTDLKFHILQLDPNINDDLIRIENRLLDESLWCNYVLQLLDMHHKLNEMDSSVKEICASVHGMNTSVQSVNTSIHGMNTSVQNMHEDIQKILSVVERKPVLCQLCSREVSESTEKGTPLQIKPYRLGQDIFTLHHQIDLRSVLNVDRIGSITDGVMMDDGRLVLCLYHPHRLLICNTDGSEVDSIPLQDIPWKVTAVNNSTVAVTLIGSYCIEMYDINNKHKLKSIPVPGWCWGITTINNKLVVGCDDGRLLMIDDQTGKVVQTIHTNSRPLRLYTSGDRIFYCRSSIFSIHPNLCSIFSIHPNLCSIFSNHPNLCSIFSNHPNLYCYSYTDHKVTSLTLPSIPYSITSLQDDSLYVVYKDGSVQHVSSNGQHYKQVKTKGLKSLDNKTVICYNRTQRKLFTIRSNLLNVYNQI